MLARWIAAGAVITVFAATAASLPAAPPSASQPIRHEDPASAAADAQPGAIFEYFLVAFSRLNTRQYEESRQLIKRLDRATVPPDVQAVVSDLNDLMVREGGLVEAVDRWVRDITALTQAGRTADAQRLLSQLDSQVRRADLLFTAMSGGIQDLRGRTEGALAANPVQRQAFDQLQRAAARVKVFLAAARATAKNPATVAAVGQLLPYETVIQLDAPQTAYPGRLVVIRGTVQERASSPSRGRRLLVYLDGALVAEAPAKAFRIQLVVPDDVAPGPHQLLAEVPAQGRYLGVRVIRSIEVTRIIPNLVARVGTWVVIPGRLSVSGSVTSELGPLRHAAVRVSLGGRSYQTTTSESGTFRVSSRLPAALDLVGQGALSILVVPNEPWVAPVTRTQNILVLNLVSLGLLTVVLIAGGVLLFRRTRKRALAEGLPEVPAAAPPRPAQWASATAPVRIAGPLAQELLAIYQQVLRRIETAAAMHAEANTTLREFVRLVPLHLEGDPLWRMTELAELALYSPHPITPALVEQARALGTQLEGALVGA